MDVMAADVWFVMPVHRRAPEARDYLRDALASLAAQTDPGWRLVLVLDAAPAQVLALRRDTDAAIAAVGVAERAIVLSQPDQRGPGAARNAGILAACDGGARLVAFLDSDDVCRSDRLAVTRAAFAADADVDLFYSAFEVIDEGSRSRDPGELPGSIAEILQRQDDTATVSQRPWRRMACQDGYLSLTSTVCVRAELAAAVPFPATYVSEDWHSWLRMFAAARRVAYSPEPLAGYRVPAGAGTGSRAEHGHFSWIKALVDSDAVTRVLIGEVARGALTEEEALLALAEHRHMSAATARSDAEEHLAGTLEALGGL